MIHELPIPPAWQQIATPCEVTAIELDPGNPASWRIIGPDKQRFVTHDNGATWASCPEDINEALDAATLGLEPGTILYVTDDGYNWREEHL